MMFMEATTSLSHLPGDTASIGLSAGGVHGPSGDLALDTPTWYPWVLERQ